MALNSGQEFIAKIGETDTKKWGIQPQTYTRDELAEEMNVNPNILTDDKCQIIANVFACNLDGGDDDDDERFCFNDSEGDMKADLMDMITAELMQ